ncbi:hypothetical protein [Micromonospora sp. ATCC 39149]|uniref:hypothetical protein n=1 Tax=Micromonospora sp. (strain ATCC 39149 / NRRL 15099 / SCC 1413) TaxID=219305 RepID=UPI0002F59B6C|nr:hypothetical protein [Micromonospora sp. ATCC 39149]
MTVAATTVRLWWRLIVAHRPLDGVCPICRVRRCRERAYARSALIVTGVWHLGPPEM